MPTIVFFKIKKDNKYLIRYTNIEGNHYIVDKLIFENIMSNMICKCWFPIYLALI